jgi:chromosome segregation ATPase
LEDATSIKKYDRRH